MGGRLVLATLQLSGIGAKFALHTPQFPPMSGGESKNPKTKDRYMKTKAQVLEIVRKLIPAWGPAHNLVRVAIGESYSAYFSADGLPLTNDAARTICRALICVETALSIDESYAFSSSAWPIRSLTLYLESGDSYALPLITPATVRQDRGSGYAHHLAGREFSNPNRLHWSVLQRLSAQLRRVASLIDRDQFRASSECRRVREIRDCAAMVPVAPTLMQRLAKRPLDPKAFRYTRAVGMEFEGFAPITSGMLSGKLPFFARAAQDGSIRPIDGHYPHEVRALFPREVLEPRLHRLLATLNGVGFRVNASCGFHIHFDMRGRTFDHVVERAKVVDKWLFALRELVPASRREGNTYCKFGLSKTDRYRAVNLCSFTAHQTLEIRLHSGTVDYTKALAWLRLCELLLAMRKKPTAADCLGTLAQLPLADHDVAFWRERHRTLNPGVYSGSAVASEIES
jgi:hypothetical protein